MEIIKEVHEGVGQRKIKELLHCISLLFCFHYICNNVLKKTNVPNGALQNLPLLLSVLFSF